MTIATLALYLLLAAACAPQEQQLTWEEIGHDELGTNYAGDVTMIIVTDVSDLSMLRDNVFPRHFEQIRETDFPRYLIVTILRRGQSVADRSVEIAAITQRKDTIVIDAHFLERDPGEVIKDMITSPYYVLKIEKTPDLHGEFEFVLVVDGQEIMSRTRTIP